MQQHSKTAVELYAHSLKLTENMKERKQTSKSLHLSRMHSIYGVTRVTSALYTMQGNGV
jgi:hypothetical protein